MLQNIFVMVVVIRSNPGLQNRKQDTDRFVAVLDRNTKKKQTFVHNKRLKRKVIVHFKKYFMPVHCIS